VPAVGVALGDRDDGVSVSPDKLVRSGHERFDGTGSPDGLVGQGIPLGAHRRGLRRLGRDITTRPYRRALSTADALAELRRCSGTQFDRVVVRALCAEIERPRVHARAVAA
jgi:HD-GYP domain-containing protein (c-di-GMP phosphodiesterase class II)